MSNILRFNTNVPVEVALRWDDGKPVEGRYGQQVMYTLADEQVMYVPPVVARQIRELGIRQGEPFEICKAEVKEGERRWIEWQVRRMESPQQPKSSGNGTAAADGDLSNNAQNHRNGSTRGVPLPALIQGYGLTVMEFAIEAAANLTHQAETRAALRNQRLQFTSEDVRAIGLTLFIQAARQGGMPWQM